MTQPVIKEHKRRAALSPLALQSSHAVHSGIALGGQATPQRWRHVPEVWMGGTIPAIFFARCGRVGVAEERRNCFVAGGLNGLQAA